MLRNFSLNMCCTSTVKLIDGNRNQILGPCKKYLLVLFFCCFSQWIYGVKGHVALTFPPARKYDLDFLDSSRTRAPCGMPQGMHIFFL